jgi:hypothetical protein
MPASLKSHKGKLDFLRAPAYEGDGDLGDEDRLERSARRPLSGRASQPIADGSQAHISKSTESRTGLPWYQGAGTAASIGA